MKPRTRLLLGACAALVLQACVMVPVTKYRYDEGCRTTVKEMTLEPLQLASIGGCANEGCAALLALAGVTAAASTVVSGSVAIVGNVVYWMERVGSGCQPAPPAAVPPALPRLQEGP